MPPLEFSHAQPIDQAAAQHLTPNCSFAHEVQTQVSAAIAHPMPGAESLMAAAPGISGPLVPGAEQAISPLIQMIMRMPGHIGLASSFFEALGNFFLPQTDMLSLFDPTHFGLHIDLSAALPADHSVIDFSLLPHDAPLLDHLGHSNLSSAHSLDLASDKLNISLGGQSHFAADSGSTSLSMGSQFNVSGQASFAKPQFEGAGGLVSGPSLSDNFSANSMATNDRLFSDGASISSASKNMIAGANLPGGTLNAPSLAQGASAGSVSSSANLGGNTLASSGTGQTVADNVSAKASSANNVSYNVFEKLSGNKEILAANNVSDSYHSTIGTIQPDAISADAVTKAATNHAASHAASHPSATAASDNPGGLKAKSMSLDGSKIELKADHAKLDQSHLDHADHTAKVSAHKADHPVEHKIDHKDESKVADATKAAKTADSITHQHLKTTSQPASSAHQPAHAQTARVSPSDSVPAEPKHVAAEAKHVAVEAKHVTAEAKHVAAETKHVAVETKHVTVETKHVAAEAKHVTAEAKPVSAQSHHGAVANSIAAAAPVAHEHIAPTQHIQSAHGQNEVAKTAAASDAQEQFGEPIKSAAGGNTHGGAGDAAQTHDAGSQTLDQKQLNQQQAPITAKAYTIRSGDCLWNIAKDQLGDATKWSDIYKMNGGVLGTNPGLIHTGASIQLPGAEGASSSVGNISHYTVKAGDNLWDIAKNQMGDASKWGDLYKANHDIIGSNPGLIRPGQELTIDTGAADPSGAQISSTGTSIAPSLSQGATPTGSAPMQPTGGDLGTVSQNPQGLESYGDSQGAAMQTSSVQHSSDVGYEAAPMTHHIQAPQAPQAQAPAVTPVKVMPVEAQPDLIIQPAHAANLTSTAGLSPEAANVVNGIAQSPKGVVNTNVASDLMSFLNKRR